MHTAIKHFLIILVLMISQGAFAALPLFGNSSETNYAAKFKPRKGKANVYIMQPNGPGGVSPKIWLNNYEVGRIVPGSFAVWQMPAGRLTVRVGSAKPVQLSLILGEGKSYLIRMTGSGSSVQLQALPVSYRADLTRYRWVKNPAKVTQVAGAQTPPPAKKIVVAPPPASTPVQKQQEKREPVVRQEAEREEQVSASSSSPIRPGGFGLMLKAGSLGISEDRQTILGTDRQFDDSASGPWAVEGYYQYNSGFSVSGEAIGYSATFTSVGGTDTTNVDVLVLLANSKQYFRTRSSLQPYIGAGLGYAFTDISGSLSGNTASVAYQLLAGIEYRTSNLGLLAEYKFISAETESDGGETIDVSGSGIFAGVAFHF